MTQQDIVDMLNHMVVGYNIHWNMIKYDADKAIMKINSYLGAEYPMMSKVLLSPQHRYTIRYKNIDLPIFPERYILTVVIPYIATEILARDEEFTTIYNKYAMDVENGLFDMFQNEFNKVPKVFRQDPDVGVYFSKDVKEHKIHEEIDRHLPEPTYKVYYHYNLNKYPSDKPFVLDVNKYPYNSVITVGVPLMREFIDNITAYTFIGWMLSPDSTNYWDPEDPDQMALVNNITEDIHLYAKWNSSCVLGNTNGSISIKDAYKKKVITLDIPAYVEGKLVTEISMEFDKGADNLTSVKLPQTDFLIAERAFTSSNLEQLVLPSYDYLRNKPSVSIDMNGIDMRNEKRNEKRLKYLYIPYSVKNIYTGGIIGVSHLQCEVESIPESWKEYWTDAEKIEVGVVNG